MTKIKVWRPPRPPYLKFNFDAAYNQSSGKCVARIVCRDEKGYIFTATYNHFFASSPLIAEAMSLREAMSLARNLNIPHAIFEEDNLLLIEACRGNQQREEIRGIIEDIKFFKLSFVDCGFT